LSDSSIDIIPELNRLDADVTVIGLLRNGAYSSEITDPLFDARAFVVTHTSGASGSLWISNTSMGALGCTEQYQFCGTTTCTELGGLYQVIDPTMIEALNLNENQRATLGVLTYAAIATRAYLTIQDLGNDFLLALDQAASANTGMQGNIYSDDISPAVGLYYSAPLSDNQWQLEVEQVHNMALAKMQRMVINRPAPPTVDTDITYDGKNFIIMPVTDAEKNLCHQQKVRSPQHSSFSVFGLLVIILSGLLIMLLRFSLPSLVTLLRKGPRSQSRLKNWAQMGVIHLMSYQLENQNDASWEDRSDSVPVTTEKGKKISWVPHSRSDSELDSEGTAESNEDDL
jgi:hypothetical protein